MKSIGCFNTGTADGNPNKNKKKSDFIVYQQRKKTMKLPRNIENFFLLLEEISSSGYKKAIKKFKIQTLTNVSENFYKKFDTLQKTEQHYYLLQLIIQVDRRTFDRQQLHIDKTITVDENDQNQTIDDAGKFLETKCKYSSSLQTTLGFIRNWKQVILKLSKHKKRLTVKHKNTLFHIPLRSYILKTNKQQLSLILQSTHEFQESNFKTIFIQFKQKDSQKFNQFCQNILDVIVTYQVDKLMMENIFNQKFEKLDDTRRNRIRIYLTDNNIQKCRNKIQVFQKQSKFQRTYQRIVTKQTLQNSQSYTVTQFKNKQGTWYEAQIKIHDRHQPRYINFLQVYQNSHKYLVKFNILQKYTEQNLFDAHKDMKQQDNKICAFYQKLKIDNKIYGQQLFLQKIRNKQEGKQILNVVNLDHAFNQNFIDFLKISLEPQQKKSTQQFFLLKLLIKFNSEFYDAKYGSEHFVQFIKQFYLMFQRLRNSSTQQKTQVSFKQMNSKFYIEKDLITRFQSEDQSPMDFVKKNTTPSGYSMFIKRLSVTDVPCNAHLRRNHRLVPTTQKIGKLMKQHYLYKQWQRLPKGGLKCINYELVAFQKSLYKAVLKKFGQNILKGRNIINFSLPVVCFKKQSHLQSLAQSMCFCPIYLQKAAKIKDPLQKMKYSVIIMIAVGILTVQSQKPFNPILGQTYQGFVDGCPVYLEQISHHPPISAYYMVGRGYKMYGCVEPRISLLLNGATGYSNLPHYIQFDDGTIIQLIFAKITITGMLLGDREFYFQDKIYAFDKTHNLFTQLVFGPFKSGGLFSSSSEPQDYFHGKIYEVTDKYKQAFSKSTPRIYPGKNDIVKEHLMFDGIWSGSVHIDGQQIINFKTDLPYQFVEEQCPIPSDSRYRTDLQKLVEGDKQAAQKEKEIMEEEQRRDKKLRNKQIKG